MKLLKTFFITIGIVFLAFNICHEIFPQKTTKIINKVSYYINGLPSEDLVNLTLDETNGLYYVSADVNGVEIEFILDTGCSCILISKIELAYLMRRGVISSDDYIGQTDSSDADGDITSCDVYNIKELTIGSYVLKNINCAVSNRETSNLLLGQDVLSKFSNVTIDYSNHTLKLEP